MNKFVILIKKGWKKIVGSFWTIYSIELTFFTFFSQGLNSYQIIFFFILFLILGLGIALISGFLLTYHSMKIKLRIRPEDIFAKTYGKYVDVIIKYGDIFKQKGHKIIGVSTQFDLGHEPPEMSIFGQFLEKFYRGNHEEYKHSLQTMGYSLDDLGLNQEFGRTILIKQQKFEWYYLFGMDLYRYSGIESFVNIISYPKSLKKLWETIEQTNTDLMPVSIPLVGIKFGRAKIMAWKLVLIILKSIASYESKIMGFAPWVISPKIQIVIDPREYGEIDLKFLSKLWKNEYLRGAILSIDITENPEDWHYQID